MGKILKYSIGLGVLIAGTVFLVGGLQDIAEGRTNGGTSVAIIIGGIFLLAAWTVLRPKSKPAWTIDIFDKRN